MPDCKKCRDGSVVCGNPPSCGDQFGFGIASSQAGEEDDGQAIHFREIRITADGGRLRVATEPDAGLDSVQSVVIRYRGQPETPENLIITFS